MGCEEILRQAQHDIKSGDQKTERPRDQARGRAKRQNDERASGQADKTTSRQNDEERAERVGCEEILRQAQHDIALPTRE